jgi:16S rRNA (adenine1518-N6/adenine1519-N6)-dimethyltransferase
VVDAAFGQRRKVLRGALAVLAGSPAEAQRAIEAAGIEPTARGETLSISEFARLAEGLSGARLGR